MPEIVFFFMHVKRKKISFLNLKTRPKPLKNYNPYVNLDQMIYRIAFVFSEFVSNKKLISPSCLQ